MEHQQEPGAQTGNDPAREQVRQILAAGERAGDTAAEGAQEAADHSAQQTQRAAEQARLITSNLRSAESDAAQVAAEDRARRLWKTIEERAEGALSAGGSGLRQASQSVRARAPEGFAGEVAGQIAGALDQSGAYLEHARPDELRSDLTRLIRANPLKAMLIGIGVGYLFGRVVGPRNR